MIGRVECREEVLPGQREIDAMHEREVAPQLPSSGKILGILVRSLGIRHPGLQNKNASRYFSGILENRVSESSRMEVIEAVADALVEAGLFTVPTGRAGASSASPDIAQIIHWHAVTWDHTRSFLRPGMARVFPSHLPLIWRGYIRIAIIDLALRIAAHLHLTGTSPDVLDFLEATSNERRSRYLNDMRKEAGVTLESLRSSAKVTRNTVDAWMYNGVRPNDENLRRIATALSQNDGGSEPSQVLQELRRLYWVSDLVKILEELIGPEDVADLLSHLRRYTSQLCGIIEGESVDGSRPSYLTDLSNFGAHSRFSEPLLTALAGIETDGEWKEDILAAGTDWGRRVLMVNLQVSQDETTELIENTDGEILARWDVSNPEAFAHYQRSMELQWKGRFHEALAEVTRAVELDPLDPANQFTLGSAKGTLGARLGDQAMVEEALEACWLACTLDPEWILPWAEVGWILLLTGRPREAVNHLKNVSSERAPLDSRYYTALGVALQELEEYEESLSAFESSLELDPHDANTVQFAAISASLGGNSSRFNDYEKVARYLGKTDSLDRFIALKNLVEAEAKPGAGRVSRDRKIPELSESIRQDPGNAHAYLQRGIAHFEKEDDDKAISDLDAAIRLEPENVANYMIRGMIYGYLDHFDRVIVDMTEAIRLDPENAMAYYHRGLAHGEMDDLQLALSDLDEAIRLDPNHADSYRARGDCHRFRHENDRAIADFDVALQLDPEEAMSYRGRGAAYRGKGDLDRAIADFDVALRLDPEDNYSYRFHGAAYVSKGDLEQAVSDFDMALSINPDDEVAYRRRGDAYLLSGNFDLAIANYNGALECDPFSGTAYFNRGLARELKGDPDGAGEDYSRARELGYVDSG